MEHPQWTLLRVCCSLLLLLAMTGCASAFADARVERVDYKGWRDCYRISNPLASVVVVPQIGGRIMEYAIQGESPIWQNRAEIGITIPADVGKKWHNYGGYKAWNSPQERWRAPDYDNFYDYAPAAVEVIAPGTVQPGQSGMANERMAGVRVTTTPIPHLGFQFVREIYLSDRTTRLRLVETMRNTSDREIEWGVWDVTQVKAPCWVAFPLAVTSGAPEGWLRLLGPENPDPHSVTPVGNVGVMRVTGALDKAGTQSPDGWMAYLKDQLAYVKQWSVRRVDATYPDRGCNSAVFTSDRAMGGYVEMEVMGPIVRLRPGETTTLVEDWFLSRVNQSAADPTDVVERLKLLQRRGLLPRSTKF